MMSKYEVFYSLSKMDTKNMDMVLIEADNACIACKIAEREIDQCYVQYVHPLIEDVV